MYCIIYSLDKMKFLKIDSTVATPAWTEAIDEAEHFPSVEYANLWIEQLNDKCEIVNFAGG